MDFVVVSKRGVILIEVKNWTDTYIFKHRSQGGLEPHEQVEELVEYYGLVFNRGVLQKNQELPVFYYLFKEI